MKITTPTFFSNKYLFLRRYSGTHLTSFQIYITATIDPCYPGLPGENPKPGFIVSHYTFGVDFAKSLTALRGEYTINSILFFALSKINNLQSAKINSILKINNLEITKITSGALGFCDLTSHNQNLLRREGISFPQNQDTLLSVLPNYMAVILGLLSGHISIIEIDHLLDIVDNILQAKNYVD